MLSATINGTAFGLEYDSANRLISAGGHTYTYNAEDVRIRNLCDGYDTTYTYNTNCKLSQLLMKTTNGIVTKYVYGRGLIGEETESTFKTYHFDYRGSIVAITDSNGTITDTFAYDTYGKLISRTGTSFVIFGYNGRDGVVTDKNGLIYMRARYYSPELRRFVNADILPGEISNAVTLNRYAYANGNPVSNVDPFGLVSEEKSSSNSNWYGAAVYEKISVTTTDDEFDLTFGLNLIRLAHTQTITTTKKQDGTTGELFGAYAYTDVNVNGYDSSAGVGIFSFISNIDFNVKWLGIGMTQSINIGNGSANVNIEIDVFGDTSVSVGLVNELENGYEVNDQYGIKMNTWSVVCVAAGILSKGQVDFNTILKRQLVR